MGSIGWHNAAMRWPWTGIEQRLDALVAEMAATRRDYNRMVEEHRAFTREMVTDMHRHAEAREREVNGRLAEMQEESREYRERTRVEHVELIAESRAGREALFRMFDRLPPPATGAA
jgi:hypothetical protein